MNKAYIEKNNRKKASGSSFPLAYEQMQRLRIIYKSRLSHRQLMVLLTLWLKQQFNDVDKYGRIPDFQRISCTNDAAPNRFRIVRDKSISWVEYSISVNTQNFVGDIWMPTPKVLNSFFWQVLRSESNNKTILAPEEANGLYQYWTSHIQPPVSMRGIKVAHKTRWRNYISRYMESDSELCTNSKALYLTQAKQHHKSALAYQEEDITKLRYKLYHSLNRAIERLFLEVDKDGITADFIKKVRGVEVVPSRTCEEVSYLYENKGRIPAWKMTRSKNFHEKSEIIDQRVGASRTVTLSEVSAFFQRMNIALQQCKPKPRAPKEDHRYFYNMMTHVLGLQLIVLTSQRPTHAISPQLAAYSSDRLCIKDKGQAREVLLNDFLQAQLTKYLLFQAKLLRCYPTVNHKPSRYVLFLINADGDSETLSAPLLRRFIQPFWPGHVPYQLRKCFSQMLLEMSLPTHLIDRAMGHSNQGEQDGAVTVFTVEEKALLEALNQLSGFLSLEPFDL